MQMDEFVVYRVRLVLPSAAATTVTSEVATSTEKTASVTTAGTTRISICV